MLTVHEAQEIVLSAVHQLESCKVPLEEALHFALAEDLSAPEPLPPFDNSAMDGYAVRAEDTQGADKDHPIRLRVIGDLPAGQFPKTVVKPGTAIRIMTGAVVPPGANAVVMVEYTRSGEDAEGPWVEILQEARPADHIRRAGEDVLPGTCVMRAGEEITPAHLGLLSALGITQVPVIRRPSVALITTGEEVIEPGETLRPGQIRNSNKYSLLGQILDTPAALQKTLHVGDDPKALQEAFFAVCSADVILSTGGVSVGAYDFAKPVLEGTGTLDFWQVAMKPGKPLAFGKIFDKPFFGLPGNPVSSMVTFEIFVRPALRKMAGYHQWFRPIVKARLTHPLRHRPGRQEYARSRTWWTPEGFFTSPFAEQGSHLLSGMVQGNSLVIVPSEAGNLPEGTECEVILLEDSALQRGNSKIL